MKMEIIVGGGGGGRTSELKDWPLTEMVEMLIDFVPIQWIYTNYGWAIKVPFSKLIVYALNFCVSPWE